MTAASETQAYPSPARARHAQVLLVVIALFTAMDVYVISLLLEPIKLDLGLTDVEVGLANTSVLYGAYALFCLPMGILADRRNRIGLLAGAMILWCLGLALTALSTGLWLLVLSKVLLGIANAVTLPASMSLLGDYFPPERRALATSSYGMGQSIGQSAAILVGGIGLGALQKAAAGDPHMLFGLHPWRVLSLAFAAAGLVLVPLLLTVREPKRMEVREARGGSFREVWAYRAFLLPLLAGTMFIAGAATAVLSWIPPALSRLYGQSPADFAGWFSAVSLVAGLAGMLAGAKLVEFFQHRAEGQSILLPAALAALVCAPTAFVATMPGLPSFAVCALVFIVAYAIVISVPVISINLRMPNELRGAVMGLYVITVSLAGALASPLVAVTGGWLGGDHMLGRGMALVGGTCSLLAAFSFWRAAGPAPSSTIQPITRPVTQGGS